MPNEKPNATPTPRRHKSAARTFTLTRTGAGPGCVLFACDQVLGEVVEVVDAEDYRDALKHIALLEGQGPGPGDPEYTVEVKMQEIVSCLKYMAIIALQAGSLNAAQQLIGGAAMLYEIALVDFDEEPWSGL